MLRPRLVLALMITMLLPVIFIETVSAYDEAYSRTPAGKVEFRELPASRYISSSRPGNYFEQSGSLFRNLFDYIRQQDIAMTVPVEGAIDNSEMRFYVGNDAPASLESTDKVKVVDLPARQVVSLGARGAYSENNLAETRSELTAWIEASEEWQATGEPYAVFWNSPFVPWFLKRYEVHVPIARIEANGNEV